MKVYREVKLKDDHFIVGDRIKCGKLGFATCQEIADKGAVFLLDDLLPKKYVMSEEETDSYLNSALRKELNTHIVDMFPKKIISRLVPDENNDLLTIPTVGQMFGSDDYFEEDGHKQWELMKRRTNRVASSKDEEILWYWLRNKVMSSANFANVGSNGNAAGNSASTSYGVRPAFVLHQ